MLGIENFIEALCNCFGLDQIALAIMRENACVQSDWPCTNVCAN